MRATCTNAWAMLAPAAWQGWGQGGSKHGKAYAAGDDGAYNLSDEAVTNT